MKTDYRKYEVPARQAIERIFIAEDLYIHFGGR